MYPAMPLKSNSFFKSFCSNGDAKLYVTVPHALCQFVDASYAPQVLNRHSLSGHIDLIGTVSVDWKCHKLVTCADSSTNAETQTYFNSGCCMEIKHCFLQQIGQLLLKPSHLFTSLRTCYDKPTQIFEDNKGTIDMCAAEWVTSNHKHIDALLQYLHELHEKGTFVCHPVSTHVQWAEDMV